MSAIASAHWNRDVINHYGDTLQRLITHPGSNTTTFISDDRQLLEISPGDTTELYHWSSLQFFNCSSQYVFSDSVILNSLYHDRELCGCGALARSNEEQYCECELMHVPPTELVALFNSEFLHADDEDGWDQYQILALFVGSRYCSDMVPTELHDFFEQHWAVGERLHPTIDWTGFSLSEYFIPTDEWETFKTNLLNGDDVLNRAAVDLFRPVRFVQRKDSLMQLCSALVRRETSLTDTQ